MKCLDKWLIGSGILVLALVIAGAAIAQQETAPAQEEPAQVSGQLPEEVLVTAQKREQDVRDVPSSVVTVSDEKLDVITSGGQDIRLLSSRVPSLHIESSYGRTLPRFYIRGLGNTDFDLNASQPVSLVYDEVVLENPILKGYPIFDLERVEVLRGPQGTLFGRNTPAGIVKFESRKPSHESGGFSRVSYGTYSSIQVEAAQNGSLVEDVLAARVSVLYQGRNDWVDNTYTGQENALGGYDDFAGRMQMLLTPADNFSALFNVHMRNLDGTARLFRADLVESGSNDIVDGFERDKIAVDGGNEQRVEERGGVARLEYDFGDVTLTSVTGYEDGTIYSRGDVDGGVVYDFDNFRFPAETADGIPKLNQFTEEIRLASNDWEDWNFQAGMFYFDEDLEIDTINYDTLGGGVQNGYAYQHQETTAWAVFGTVDVNLTDRFTASGGVRYSDDEKDFTARRDESPIGADPLDPIKVNPSDEFVSWDLSGMYAATEDVNVYGRIASSFRAPSIQGRLLFGDEVTVADTEKILSFETGVKSNIGRRARANFSVFYYDMQDQQLTAVGGGANFNRLLNADKTKGYGFEADLELLPSDRLFFTVGASYNNTEIDDPDLYTQKPGAAGVTLLDPDHPTDPTLVSIDGNSLPNAPEWVFNVTARGATPLGDDGELFLYTDWAYRSEVSFFLYESTEFTEDGMIEGGLRIGYAPYDHSYEVAAFARNITDVEYRTGGIDFNNLTGFVNEPRCFGLEMKRFF